MRASALALLALLTSACVTAPQDAPPPPNTPAQSGEQAASCSDIGSPAFVVCQFYSRYVTLQPKGLPDAQALEIFQPFLSPSLYQALEQAKEEEALRLDDDEFPRGRSPFEGQPLFSGGHVTPEGFAVLNYHAFKGEPDGRWALVRVRLDGGDQTHRWTDEVVVRASADGYVIEEFVFNPAQTTGRAPRTLRKALTAFSF